MTPLRVALIGTGAIAQSYAQALENGSETTLVAVADIRIDSATAFAERFPGCRAFASHTELTEDGPEFDAVVVCTPPTTHDAIVAHFLKLKRHVLCEKPFTTTAVSAHRLQDMAAEAGLRLSMGSKFRYVQDLIRAKSILESGILGEIILFENTFAARVEMAGRWNADPAISGGGVLIDNGTHSVDIVRYLLGPIDEVQAVEGKRVQRLPVEDTVRLFVRTAGGVMGSIDLSWSLNKEQDHFVSLYGERGTVLVGWKESKYRQSSSRDWVVFGKGYDKVQAFKSQLRNFARAIRGEERLLIDADDAVASVEVIEAAYESLRHQRWTTVAHAGDAHLAGVGA
jgi:predicted dehydrogenase